MKVAYYVSLMQIILVAIKLEKEKNEKNEKIRNLWY